MKDLQIALEKALADIGTAVRANKKREIQKAIKHYNALMATKQKILLKMMKDSKNAKYNN